MQWLAAWSDMQAPGIHGAKASLPYLKTISLVYYLGSDFALVAQFLLRGDIEEK
jgi:hypothetical protein